MGLRFGVFLALVVGREAIVVVSKVIHRLLVLEKGGKVAVSASREPFLRNAFLRNPYVIGFFMWSCQFLRNAFRRPQNERAERIEKRS